MASAASSVRAAVVSAVTALPVMIAFNDVVGGLALVRGNSMQPTFNPPAPPGRTQRSDVVCVWRWNSTSRKHGDVVLLQSPEQPGRYLMKRVTGLQGDWMRDKQGAKVRVPVGHCWVEGDNEECSNDSNAFGPVPLGLLDGKVVGLCWPPARVGPVQHELPPGKGPFLRAMAW